MAKAFAVTCNSCKAQYVLPVSAREHLEGRAVLCPACQRWWLALPATSGPPVKLVQGRPERTQIDLRKFKRGPAPAPAAPAPAAAPQRPAPPPAASAPAAPPPQQAAADSGDLTVTANIPMNVATGTPLSLRVVVTGPELDLKGVFDLGSKGFLIGRGSCHLNLPKASIPEIAVRIKAADSGFSFEGVGGFSIPVGSMSIRSGRIDTGGNLRLELAPYDILLKPSATPGSPIANLEPTAPEAPPPPEPPWPAARPDAGPGMAGQATDLRHQLQEIAIDVQPGQQPFGEEPGEAVVDLDSTMTDLSASGFQASRSGNPLQGLALSLVRADGPHKGQAFKITKSPLLIGRSADGDVTVSDRRVSSKHAQLDVVGPRVYTVKDLASTNGTTVNDRPISVGHLQDGDIIGFGGVKFEFVAKKAP